MEAIPEPCQINRFPSCVAMKLHLEVIRNTTKSSLMSRLIKSAESVRLPHDASLSLTINFGCEQEIEIPGGKYLGLSGGRAAFGIRRGQLQFAFQNCKLPLEKAFLVEPLKVFIEIEEQRSKSTEIQAGATLDSRSIGAKATADTSSKMTAEFFQIKKIGGEDKPAWIFEAYGEHSILEGTLKEELLGTLNLHDLPVKITATFTARGEDIRLSWGEIGLSKSIHRNKLALIERAIALRYIKDLVGSTPLSEGKWQYG